ncbi:very long chain fatty acid elongase AAEL008004-like [Calliopsis andreniformis]|uniref:very long chain fatty acid elongase AAEL008004-like n=1 Tax=Calliopsis andreniformis TaxID=337506 RepID=UPI003FCCB86A
MDLLEMYHYYMVEIADKRTNDWFLVGSFIPITLASLGYLYLVLDYGPRYMKDKPPYSLKRFIQFYDMFQIVINSLVVYHSFDAGWYDDYFFYCVIPDDSMNPKSYKIATIIWCVMLVKLVDFIETFLFVLRKKNRQISFLHLYHHISTLALTWISTKYWPHGMSLTIILVNCGIHVVMYTYYLLASFGQKIQLYLQPFKPIITIAQMVQFVAMILYALQSALPQCHHQRILGSTIIVNLMINLVLFYNFYRKTYKSQKSKSK